jgi:hypothetical protein
LSSGHALIRDGAAYLVVWYGSLVPGVSAFDAAIYFLISPEDTADSALRSAEAAPSNDCRTAELRWPGLSDGTAFQHMFRVKRDVLRSRAAARGWDGQATALPFEEA